MKPRLLIVPLALVAITASAFAELGPEARPQVINDADQIVFLGGAGIGSSPNALYLASPGGISLVASAGQVAPGYAPGVTIGGLDVNYHQANNGGQVTFESTLYGPGMDPVGAD